MPVSFVCFLILVITAPLDLFWSWPGLLGLRLLLVGVGLFFAVLNLSERERAVLKNATGFASFGLFLMVGWLVIQILPLGLFAHPFWASAAEALQQPLAGRMSIDVGAGVLVFCRSILAIAVGFLVAVLSIDRSRAEQILVVLTVASGLILESQLFGTAFLTVFGFDHRQHIGDDQAVFASLALVLTLSTASCIFEHFETRRSQHGYPLGILFLQEVGCLLGFLVAAVIVWLTSNPSLILAAFVGVALPAAIIHVRRLNLDPFFNGLLLTVLLCTLFGAMSDIYFRMIEMYSSSSSSFDEMREATTDMLGDAPSVGSGAGTFSNLLPLYHSQIFDHTLAGTPGALILEIELGRGAFWLLVFFAVLVIFRLMRGGLLRGRDSFYAAAGAGCLSVLVIDLFATVGGFSPSNWIFASAATGLALAQTQSSST